MDLKAWVIKISGIEKRRAKHVGWRYVTSMANLFGTRCAKNERDDEDYRGDQVEDGARRKSMAYGISIKHVINSYAERRERSTSGISLTNRQRNSV